MTMLFELEVRRMPLKEFELAVLFVTVLFEPNCRMMPYPAFELAMLFVTVLLFDVVFR